MAKFKVKWHTHTLHGGRYEGTKTVFAEDREEAGQRTQREVQQGAFQDLYVSSIKIDDIIQIG